MATCDVLRCQNEAEAAVRLTPEDANPMHARVCGDHKARMDAGQPWRWDPDETATIEGSILMGEDLSAREITVTGYKGWEQHGLVMAHDGTDATTLLLERLNSDGTREELRLSMSDQLLDQLADDLSKLWGSKGGGQAPAEG
jgi:hypothetical protein